MGELAQLAQALYRGGYRTVHRDFNPRWPQCVEFTLLRYRCDRHTIAANRTTYGLPVQDRVGAAAASADPEARQSSQVEGAQRPNRKSEDSGLRHRFSEEAKVSLWMGENEATRGGTRTDSSVTLLHAVQNFSQRERDVVLEVRVPPSGRTGRPGVSE